MADNDIPSASASYADNVVHLAVPERLTGGRDGGDDGGMNARLDRLEKRADGFDAKLSQALVDLAEIKGRLSNLPTTFQVMTWFVGVAIGLVALTFAIARVM
ncbi:MAG: hypothetical protein AB7R90_19330 [Reyranellaceae bacterium]